MEFIDDLVVTVLLNYNQNDYTIKCVESLLESDYKNHKLLLIDNGSEAANVTLLEKMLPDDDRLKFVKLEDNIGYAQGTNYGLEEGLKLKPTYFFILNNDTVVAKDAISELVATSKKHKDKARVTGKVFHYDEPKMIQFIAYKMVDKKFLTFERLGNDELDKGQFDSLEELDMMDDIFVLQPASLYETIGGYSKYLWVNGVNIDISLRAKQNGYKLVFTPKAKIWHKGSVSFGGRTMNPKLAYWNIQSKLILRYIHVDRISFIQFYLKILFNDVLRTMSKAIFLKIIGKKDMLNYAKSKLMSLIHFHIWTIKKNENTGYNPF